MGQNLLSHGLAHMGLNASFKTCLQGGFRKKRNTNQSAQPQRLVRKIEISHVVLDMMLSKNRITKALISLRGCAGQFAPLLFANPRRHVFSRQGLYFLLVEGVLCWYVG